MLHWPVDIACAQESSSTSPCGPDEHFSVAVTTGHNPDTSHSPEDINSPESAVVPTKISKNKEELDLSHSSQNNSAIQLHINQSYRHSGRLSMELVCRQFEEKLAKLRKTCWTSRNSC
ncbi:unnamed protein product [Protopolystoma xenopodis]|uniref:Uncharacterized protein n=1 Tax=Protopolystoma xenopodis TaxID=117903 RepID=A0A448XMY1_9PLAT|nr:unnamed protein product [Protopolystoma xenopodis]